VNLPPSGVRGGKEELRASVLKTYLLRLRSEKGERAVRAALATVGVDHALVDNETAWVSAGKARRALKALSRELGGDDALRHRGAWVTQPESLGTMVRMLRAARRPLDAYRYLAQNARESTRIGSWEIAEPEGKNAPYVRMTYKLLPDSSDDREGDDGSGERLLCAARIGELAGYPRLWGLADAEVVHRTCLAHGGDACVYEVRWSQPGKSFVAILFALLAAGVVGGAVTFAGGPLIGALAGLLAAILGGGAGFLWNRAKLDAFVRAFERHRIAALERGLALRGDTAAASTPGVGGELAGTVLGGKYRIGKKIGSGGIGAVYAAEHTTLGHEVAVKVLRGAAAKDGSEIARLRREAYIQVHVEHPNIARVMDLDQMPDGSIYVVMERLHGRSLADKMARELVTPGFAIPMFAGVCRALEAAHQKGVVHRDLKPGNVFLCEDGTAKVLDFGMSKLNAGEALTQAGYTLGTPEYMAPEQCIGAAVEARTDLYALGVLMYEALTGALPIQSSNRRELLDLHQRQIPKSMRARRPDLDIPEALDAIVMQCLAKRPNDRPPSAREVEQALTAISTEGMPLTYPSTVKRSA
jgi:serine/threonine-protein kinase